MRRFGDFLSPLARSLRLHWPLATLFSPHAARHTPLIPYWPLFCRPSRLAAGRGLGLFSGSIPPWFVLSNNLSTTNTRAIWLCFGAFLSPPASSLQFHWPLITILPSHAPRPTPGPAGSGRAQTLPRWLLPDTDSRFGKDRTGPDLDERSLSFSMAPNRAIPTEKSIRLSSLPTVA